MDFNQLKELARKLGGILVMNGNNPEFVVLPFYKYQKNDNGKKEPVENISEEDGATIDRLNKEISALKEEIRQKEEAEISNDVEEDIEEENREKVLENEDEMEELT
jgi:hypothetical protein